MRRKVELIFLDCGIVKSVEKWSVLVVSYAHFVSQAVDTIFAAPKSKYSPEFAAL
jgi:hypothetical protein